MRTKLQPLEGIRKTYIANFVRHDTFMTRGRIRRKVLLKNIRDSRNQPMADHVSIADPESIEQMATLKEGDLIRFTAEVYSYSKCYEGDDIEARLQRPFRIDYGLWNVRDVVKLNIPPENRSTQPSPSFETLKKDKKIALGVCTE
jgi:hypothetical protein